MFAVKCLMTLVFVLSVDAADFKLREDLQSMADQIEHLRTLHVSDVTRLKREIENLKEQSAIHSESNHERNELMTLQWARNSLKEIRAEMRELADGVNNSALLKQLHTIRNELKQALMETADLAQLARTQETRVDKLDSQVSRLKYEEQQMRAAVAELRIQLGKLSKEVNNKQLEQLMSDDENDVVEVEEPAATSAPHSRRYRHNKMVHVQISRLAKSQDQLDTYQQNLQEQILDVQRRLDRFGEPNWNLISAKVEFLELETKVMRDQIKNTTQEVSDFEKVHSSLLELREDLEGVENKADKIMPEFRKEISKLDMNYAQLTAQSSYLKEDQENLRQSVKAIAVSVSNAVDRADLDRAMLNKLNDCVSDLQSFSKQHFYKLNDHILKTEANTVDDNTTMIVPLPELMGEVKELQPVEREYEDLVNQLPKDCSTISGPAGVYLIHPGYTPIDTWCSNKTTLLQRRYNGSVEFNRKFDEYAKGFGDPTSEYWLGLETMHLLTADNCSSMRIDMTDIYGGNWYAQYDHFSVSNADSGYILNVAGFKGNASDAFEYQNHMEFSAIDRDRDISNTHCAGNYEGGWWYSHCQHVNINGKYTLGLTWFDSARNEWIAVATSEMKLSRRPGCH